MSEIQIQKEIDKLRQSTKFIIALAGNPNVGKSTIFNRLTGLGVVTANYPGKTVELNLGTADFNNQRVGIIDLPGIYSLGSISEDQYVARQELLNGQADVVLVIVDATNLERNLYLVLQLLDYGYPVVVGCNLMDLAVKNNICLDTEKLASALGIPVVPVTATTGEGVDKLIEQCANIATGPITRQARRPAYGKDIMDQIDELASVIEHQLPTRPYRLTAHALAIMLFEEDKDFQALLSKTQNGQNVLEKAKTIFQKLEKTHGEKPSVRLSRERHGLEGTITDAVQKSGICPVTLSTKLWRISLRPLTGLPILLAGMIIVFMIMFYLGSYLSTAFDYTWSQFVSPWIKIAITSLAGNTPVARILLWGFDAGIQAALSVGIPYILTFYLILSFLEDTGYLNSIAFLTDSLMHKLGLHGRSVIPLIAGAGCNVPAIIGTRVLTTRKEKLIACTLITLVPCSARTAIIMGAVAVFVGWQWAIAIYLIDLLVGIIVGRLLAITLPGESSGLVMEMFPFRLPSWRTVAKKTWYRMKEFIIIAIPIIAIGSLVLGFLYESQYLWLVTKPFSLIIEGWLGLPAIAGICLVFGVLRKELALQLLLSLAIIKYGSEVSNLLHFMTRQQIFVFALVTTLYIPCLAAISALVKELNWRAALAISAFTITIAIIVGGVVNQLLSLTGWLAHI